MMMLAYLEQLNNDEFMASEALGIGDGENVVLPRLLHSVASGALIGEDGIASAGGGEGDSAGVAQVDSGEV